MTLLGLLFLDLGKRDFFFNRGRTEGSWELVGVMTYHDTDLYSLIDLGQKGRDPINLVRVHSHRIA